MKTLTLLTVILLLFVARFLHWLAIFQQKEYRFDRLKAFFSTTEGKREIRQLLINRYHLNPKRWKRPAITPRIIMIAVFSGAIMVAPLVFVIFSSLVLSTKLISILFIIIFEYIFMPAIIGCIVALSAIPAKIKTENELKRAQRKIAKGSPLIIGIGGSYGKTSTKYLIHAVLSQKFSVFKTPKSFNAPFSIAKSINDNYQGEEIVLLEYGAYQIGEIQNLTKWFQPNHAIVTGFTEQHLHLFGSIESSYQAESELIIAVDSSSNNSKSQVWFNADDLGVSKILEFAEDENADRVAYSANQILDFRSDKRGFLELDFDNQKSVKTRLVGDHYLTNLSVALLVGKFFGLNSEEIARSIASFEPDERFVRSYQGKNVWILDDAGTSNPKGFEQIIKIADELEGLPKILITSGIVDLGDQSERIHSSLATAVGEVFDKVLYVGSAGKSDFESVISKKIVTEPNQILEKLIELAGAEGKKPLIVIEGRMPGWLNPSLKTIGVKT